MNKESLVRLLNIGEYPISAIVDLMKLYLKEHNQKVSSSTIYKQINILAYYNLFDTFSIKLIDYYAAKWGICSIQYNNIIKYF